MAENNQKYWLRSGTINLLLNFQNLLFNFGSFYFLVRILGKHGFGLWSLFVASTAIFDVVRSGLIQNALIRFLSHEPKENHAEIIGTSFWINNGLSLIFLVVSFSLSGYFAHLWNFPDIRRMLYVYGLVYILQGVFLQFQWLEQAYLNFTGVLLSSVIRQGGFFFYVFFSALRHSPLSLINLVFVQALLYAVGILVQYFFIREKLKFSFQKTAFWFRRLMHFGKFPFGSSIAAMVNNSIIQMMIGTMLSPEMAGTYGVCTRIINLTDIPGNVVGVIVFPQNAKRFASHGESASRYLYEKSVGTILALNFPYILLLLFFPKWVVNLIAGGNYGDAIPIIRFAILFTLFNPIGRMFGIIIDSIGKPRISFIMVSLFALLNLVFNFWLIPPFGVMGSIYGTVLTDLVIHSAMLIILYRLLGVNPLNALRYALTFYPEFYQTYVRRYIRRIF